MFVQGEIYTRADVQDALDVPDGQRGGAWDTGYRRYENSAYVFCNVGVAGRTGHDYANRWDGERLVWFGKTRSKVTEPLMSRMVGGGLPVHIFWRADGRPGFTYAGVGTPVDVKPTSPVEVTWRFEGAASGREVATRRSTAPSQSAGSGRSAPAPKPDEDLRPELSRLAQAMHDRIQQSGLERRDPSPLRTGPGMGDLMIALQAAWSRQEGRCALCERPIPLKPASKLLQMSPDRMDSLDKSYGAANVHLAHLGCNLAKSDAELSHWRAFLDHLRSPA